MEVVFMSTYYDYQEVGVMIAHKLMKMDGWTVYGYNDIMYICVDKDRIINRTKGNKTEWQK